MKKWQKANITAQLNQPGDKVVFTLTIHNEGNIAADLAEPVVSLMVMEQIAMKMT